MSRSASLLVLVLSCSAHALQLQQSPRAERQTTTTTTTRRAALSDAALFLAVPMLTVPVIADAAVGDSTRSSQAAQPQTFAELLEQSKKQREAVTGMSMSEEEIKALEEKVRKQFPGVK